jgi:hypothetical protein
VRLEVLGQLKNPMTSSGSEPATSRLVAQCLNQLRTRVSHIHIRGRVTNGSKTAIMHVMGFLYVPLGSSTVQLHDSLGSRRACACSVAGFSSQNGDLATGVYYRRAAFCCAFLWAKGLNAKDIHKELFPVYGGKCLSCKSVHSWVEKSSQGRSAI